MTWQRHGSLQGQKSQQTASRPVLGAVTKTKTLCHSMGLASRGASATFRDMGFGLRGNKACNMLLGSFHELPRPEPCPFLQQNTFRRQEFGAPKLGFLHGLLDRCSSEARPPSNLQAKMAPSETAAHFARNHVAQRAGNGCDSESAWLRNPKGCFKPSEALLLACKMAPSARAVMRAEKRMPDTRAGAQMGKSSTKLRTANFGLAGPQVSLKQRATNIAKQTQTAGLLKRGKRTSQVLLRRSLQSSSQVREE